MIEQEDILIIGAGVIGCSIARELSRYELKIRVLEKEFDICQGASKANSGCVHGGYDAQHGTLKSKLSRKGNQMFSKLNEELDFGFDMCGSMVVAFTAEEENKLKELLENGIKNGVHDLKIIDRQKVLEMEPHISVGVRCALHCPSAGIVMPYEYCFALAENAMSNGVKFDVGKNVIGIDILREITSKKKIYQVRTDDGSIYKTRHIINCAGIYADYVAKLVNANCGFSILPRKGQYILLDKEQGSRVNSIIFQTPTKKWGKGILVVRTMRGNLLLGPSASEESDKEEKNTNTNELAYVAWAARRSVPHLDTRQNIKDFAGLRARSSAHDFIIARDANEEGFINVAGIESPGLTSSPAIALMVKDILHQECGLELIPNPKFSPWRKHPVSFGIRKRPEEIVCKCEQITRGEIIQAIDQAGIPIMCTDSVKYRARAGMGHCQGARCRHLVAEIIAEKCHMDDFTKVPKRVPKSVEPIRLSRKELSRL